MADGRYPSRAVPEDSGFFPAASAGMDGEELEDSGLANLLAHLDSLPAEQLEFIAALASERVRALQLYATAQPGEPGEQPSYDMGSSGGYG